MKKLFLGIFLTLYSIGQAQSVPTPAPIQDKPVVITHATIHIGNGQMIENASIRFENGKIIAIGQVETTHADIIDGTGKHIYPGFIAPHSQIGLIEIEAARATADFYEVQSFAPIVRSLIAYNVDSRVTPTIRSNGILVTQIVPQGHRISGRSSIVQLDAWTWEDAAIKIDNGLHLSWPSLSFSPTENNPIIEQEKKQNNAIEEIYAYFKKAQVYNKTSSATPIDLNLEAMRPFVTGKETVFIQAQTQKEIRSALRFIEQFQLKAVIVGAKDAWRLTDELKKQNIPILLGNIHSLPMRSWEDIQQPYKNPAILLKAGIKVGLYMEGSWNVRNLPFQAGQCVPFGLNKEEALQLITKNNAEILGISDRLGTLEIGKDATLILSDGDVLDMKTSVIRYAWIQGRKINLNNHQTDLYKKYKK